MEIIEVDEAHKDSEFRVAALLAGFEGKKVLYACATWDQARRVEAKLFEFLVAKTGKLAAFIKTRYRGKTKLGIEFYTGGGVSFRGADTSGRGYAADVLIMDGLSEVEQCAALPCVAARDGCVYRVAKGD